MDATKALVWNEIVDHEGKLFFWVEQVNGQQTGPENEIQFGVHMEVDWYVIHAYSTCDLMLIPLPVFLGSHQSLGKHSTQPKLMPLFAMEHSTK